MESAKEVDSRHERLLPLPVGNSDWVELRREYWSADKTQLISGLLERKAGIAVLKYGVGFLGKRVSLAK